jgi:enoyl-CoA hydratase/carnithine racemase
VDPDTRGCEPQPTIGLSFEAGVAMLSFGTPILSQPVLAELSKALGELERNPQPLVLTSSHPAIFLAGAHLAEIAALGPRSSRAYAEHGRGVLAGLTRHPAPVVAAVHGVCAGGGFDLALNCDLVVAGPAASFSHPGVRRGLVTGWGGTAHFAGPFGDATARRIFIAGEPLAAAELGGPLVISSGRTHPLSRARAEACRLGRMDRTRMTLWRCLRRGRFIDRFRAVVVHNQCR